MTETALTRTNGNGELAERTFSVSMVVDQTRAIQECMRAVMKKDDHYGVIPGTPKPSLLQPGADKLIMLFWLKPRYEVLGRVIDHDFISYEIRCTLVHRRSGEEWGEGMGACNSKEKRYTSQQSEKTCPRCSKPAIIKGKKEYGGGWLCFGKKGGCGAKFRDDDEQIVQQDGAIKRDAAHDLQNTILKMACKRAKVAAVLTATAASDIFTQDLEDLEETAAEYAPPKASTPPSAPPAHSGAEEHASSIDEPDPLDGQADIVADEPAAGEYRDMVETWQFKVTSGSKKAGNLQGEWITMGLRYQRSKDQNAKIHALKGELKIPDAEWRSKLANYYNKTSSAELSVDEATDLIDRLERTKAAREGKAQRQERRGREAVAEIAEYIGERETGSEG